MSMYDWQLSEAEYCRGERVSLAVIKLQCCDAKDNTKLAFMRIYLQVPYSGTEMDTADERAIQATTYIPRELLAYKELTLKNLGFTPEPFIVQNLNTGKVGGTRMQINGNGSLAGVPSALGVSRRWRLPWSRKEVAKIDS